MPGSFLKRTSGVEAVKFDSPRSKFDSPKVNKLSLGTPKSKEKKAINLHDFREEVSI